MADDQYVVLPASDVPGTMEYEAKTANLISWYAELIRMGSTPWELRKQIENRIGL